MVFAQKFGSGERFENVLCSAGRFFAAALRILKFPLHCSIFVPKINTGEHQLPQHKSGYLHRIKRKLRAVSPYGLFFVRFRQSRSCFKTLKFQPHARTFQVRSGICFFDSVCGLSGQFVDSAVLILKSEVCRTAFSQNRSWLKSFFAGSIFVRRKNRKFRRYFCYEENNCTVCSGFDAALCSSFRRNR